MATLFAGTSGFAYPAWKPEFYPPEVPATRFLEHYASRLNCVEINYTFRQMPRAATLDSWVNATPSGFVFVMKAHQRITHMQRLKGAEEATAFFLDALEPLRRAGRLGAVLFQLPPNLRCDVDRLAAFLQLLPAGLRVALEFRDTSWFTDDVYALLRGHNAALCLAESEKLVVPEVITADFVYYRLRKPGYSEEELAALSRRSGDLVSAGSDVYLIFKHEESPTSALDAEQLLRSAGARAA